MKRRCALRRRQVALRPVIDRCEPRLMLDGAAGASAAELLRGLPMRFEPSAGGADYVARGVGYSLFLNADEAVLSLSGGTAGRSVLRMNLVGADPSAKAVAGQALAGASNYLVGADPSTWRTNVTARGSVTYDDVYPGVDVVYRGDGGQLEYDFVVAPGADAGVIELGFDGADRLSVDADGNLIIATALGDVVQKAPVMYQTIDGARTRVAGRFVLGSDDRVRYDVGSYDRSKPLVIDPVLVYSTYLGGTNVEDLAGVTNDGTGAMILVGRTESEDFPGAASGYQTFLRPDSDIFVAKVATDGKSLVFATYLGGYGEEAAQGRAAVDGDGNIYVCGTTLSTDFPTTSNRFQGNQRNDDGFLSKLNATGNQLLYSTYIGGNNNDYATNVAVDSTGAMYVLGSTNSDRDFPISETAFQKELGGKRDAFVVKIDLDTAGGSYSTYLGGSEDELYSSLNGGIAVDGAGNAFVTGDTLSGNFPISAAPFQSVYGGSRDAFVTKLNATGSAVFYSTYLGGPGMEQARDLALDSSGRAVITGLIEGSPSFPSSGRETIGVGGQTDVFVGRLDEDGEALELFTVIGGSGTDEAMGLALNADGVPFVAGWTSSGDFPVSGAIDAPNFPSQDAFVFQMADTWSSLTFSTTIGGTGDDRGADVAVDALGNIYVGGTTGSADFPLLNPLQGAKYGPTDAFVTKIDPIAEPAPKGPLTPGDYDGDGKADVVSYVQGTTNSLGEFEIRRSSDGTTTTVPFGVRGDIPVAGDFDGDGKGDIAIFRPNVDADGNGTSDYAAWFIRYSSTGQMVETPFGGASGLDLPAQADFDGDGITDIVTFRPISDTTPGAAEWFILPSKTKQAYSVAFGAAGGLDLPAQADFDGDGKADIATFRPASDLVQGAAQWFILPSANNQGYSVLFGAASGADQPVPADYDGDGKADIAAFRSVSDLDPTHSQWFILPSATQAGYSVTLGNTGDIAAVGDYEGDQQPDLAVYSPTTSRWLARLSTAGRDGSLVFGTAGSVPVLAPLQFRLDDAAAATGTASLSAARASARTASYPGGVAMGQLARRRKGATAPQPWSATS